MACVQGWSAANTGPEGNVEYLIAARRG